MGNVWAIHVQSVCKDMRPCQGKDKLINAIRNAWESITKETLSQLATTMTDRLIKVIEKKVHL